MKIKSGIFRVFNPEKLRMASKDNQAKYIYKKRTQNDLSHHFEYRSFWFLFRVLP